MDSFRRLLKFISISLVLANVNLLLLAVSDHLFFPLEHHQLVVQPVNIFVKVPLTLACVLYYVDVLA